MSANTKIEWADHSWSPWRGCSKIAEGCANCYADAISKRNPGTLGVWGPNGTRVVAASWAEVRQWNRSAAERGVIETVFPSLCDPFEEWSGDMVSHRGHTLLRCGSCLGWTTADYCAMCGRRCRHLTMSDVRGDLFDLIDETPNLRWLLLTKRPGNVRDMWPKLPVSIRRRGNVALVYSASTQADLEAGIGDLLACRDLAPTLGLSLEPLVGPIDFRQEWVRGFDGTNYEGVFDDRWSPLDDLDWIIAGGESGHGARPCNVQWIRDVTRQCHEADVPCFVKQLGANIPDGGDCDIQDWPGFESFVYFDDGRVDVRLNDPKGGDWSEWPDDLRVREYPWEASPCP